MIVKKAGTVLINKDNKQIALVYRKKLHDLSFPKGHLEDGESLEECAIRETIEETGRDCHLLSSEYLDIIKYRTFNDEDVENYMYLAIDDGKHIGESVDPEICVWVSYEDVYEALSYDDLKEFWKNIYSKVEKIINDN